MVCEAFTHAGPESIWVELPLLGYSEGPQRSLSLSQAAWTGVLRWLLESPAARVTAHPPPGPELRPSGALALIHKEKRCDAEKHCFLFTTLHCLLKNMEERQGRVKLLCRKRWKYMEGGVAVETEALWRKVKGEGTVCG